MGFQGFCCRVSFPLTQKFPPKEAKFKFNLNLNSATFNCSGVVYVKSNIIVTSET